MNSSYCPTRRAGKNRCQTKQAAVFIHFMWSEFWSYRRQSESAKDNLASLTQQITHSCRSVFAHILWLDEILGKLWSRIRFAHGFGFNPAGSSLLHLSPLTFPSCLKDRVCELFLNPGWHASTVTCNMYEMTNHLEVFLVFLSSRWMSSNSQKHFRIAPLLSIIKTVWIKMYLVNF